MRTRRRATARPAGREFALSIEASGEELAAARGVRAYAWDVSRNLDALGAADLAEDLASSPAAAESAAGSGL